MISVVIRNKNEAQSLKVILNILRKVYSDDIDEIIIVDNNSIDQSVLVAEKFKCKIITIENFTYGKAINLGIENAKNNLVLLLSSHAVPIGNSFFKNSVKAFAFNPELAGMRYINSLPNYARAIDDNFEIKNGLSYGLMAACAMVNKKIWEKHKFNEKLVASEDKEWSDRVLKAGFKISDFNETYFYHIKRSERGNLNRWKIETIAHYQLHKSKYPSILKLILVFIKKTIWILPLEYLKAIFHEIKLLRLKLIINRLLKNKIDLDEY